MTDLFVLFVLLMTPAGGVNTAAGGYPTMEACQSERSKVIEHVLSRPQGQLSSYIAECLAIRPVEGA